MQTLLHALTGLGLTVVDRGRYTNAPAAQRWLVHGAPDDYGDYFCLPVARQIHPALLHLDAGIAGTGAAFVTLRGLLSEPDTEVMRFGLKVYFAPGPDDFPILLWRSRDPDIRVRTRAVEIARRVQGQQRTDDMTPIFFGALYDPGPGVQGLGVDALMDGSIKDSSFQSVGVARLVEVWSKSHRQVRVSAARGRR